MESKRFIAVTIVLYLSSLISYYAQIKVIDLYGLDVKYYLDLYTSYLQITITLIILGLPNAISIMVSKDKKTPKHIKRYSALIAVLSSTILNVFFLDGSVLVQLLIFVFVFVSLCNDLNTGVMSSIGMFEYPRVWLLIGNIILLLCVLFDPLYKLFLEKPSSELYALAFILIPILPLFMVTILGKKFNEALVRYESVSLRAVFKYLSYIYLFSILSIVLTRVPYINYSAFIDKYYLAQYTLSVSLSNFMVIPLSTFTLKVLSSDMESKINIKLMNLILLSFILVSALTLYYVSSNFDLLHQLANISSSDILASTFLVIGGTAISSINLSVSLRRQYKLKSFLILDLVLVAIICLITLNVVCSFQHVSDYNYLIASVILLKILFQVYFLREPNVHDYNRKL